MVPVNVCRASWENRAPWKKYTFMQILVCCFTKDKSFYLLFLANLLLQDAIERIHVGQKYGDIHRGVFLIRGENVVLLGEFVSNRMKD